MNDTPYRRFHREFARAMAEKYSHEYEEFERVAIIGELQMAVDQAEYDLAEWKKKLAAAKGDT